MLDSHWLDVLIVEVEAISLPLVTVNHLASCGIFGGWSRHLSLHWLVFSQSLSHVQRGLLIEFDKSEV